MATLSRSKRIWWMFDLQNPFDLSTFYPMDHNWRHCLAIKMAESIKFSKWFSLKKLGIDMRYDKKSAWIASSIELHGKQLTFHLSIWSVLFSICRWFDVLHWLCNCGFTATQWFVRLREEMKSCLPTAALSVDRSCIKVVRYCWCSQRDRWYCKLLGIVYPKLEGFVNRISAIVGSAAAASKIPNGSTFFLLQTWLRLSN